GKRLGGDLSDRRIGLERTPAGLRLQRGKDGDADHLYATFGWAGLVNAVSSSDPSGLIPTEFRLATKTVAIELEDEELAEGTTMPATAKRIGGMHALFKETLTTFS